MTPPGRLLVFEGPDGVGKTTLADALCRHLRNRSIPVRLLAFPGNEPGSLGFLVYQLHHRPAEFGLGPFDAASLQAMHVAAHIDAVRRTILPDLRAGTWIVLDRFWWSTWVYGRLADVPADLLEGILAGERLSWGQVQPEMLFLVSRAVPLGNADRSQHSRLAALYAELSAREGGRTRVHTLQNDGSVAEALAEVLVTVSGIAERR